MFGSSPSTSTWVSDEILSEVHSGSVSASFRAMVTPGCLKNHYPYILGGLLLFLYTPEIPLLELIE